MNKYWRLKLLFTSCLDVHLLVHHFHTINSNKDSVDVICEEIIKYLQTRSFASQVNVSLFITNFNSHFYSLMPYKNYAESP